MHAPKGFFVGSQGIVQSPGVASVMLGAGRRPSFAEAASCLGLTAWIVKPRFHHGLDNGLCATNSKADSKLVSSTSCANDPSHAECNAAVQTTGKRLRAAVFYHRPSAHFAAPASAGCLQRRVFPRTLFFVESNFSVTVFAAAVSASLEADANEYFLQAFHAV